MAKVLGLGGFFFACKDVQATRDWYARVLGIEFDDFGGAMFPFKTAIEAFGDGALTVWSPYGAKPDYFAPSTENHMVNFIVDDLSAVLARCAREGAPEVKPRETYPYGCFGWIMDLDGRKIELWQPTAAPPSTA